jgi:hypothetical protein
MLTVSAGNVAEERMAYCTTVLLAHVADLNWTKHRNATSGPFGSLSGTPRQVLPTTLDQGMNLRRSRPCLIRQGSSATAKG